ncbi:MAG: hypothetical protein P4L43_13925 [Syntrophobacteraceae bacterium]|nr:hypothetical protein [Syntrophobacteraceae bacterium]
MRKVFAFAVLGILFSTTAMAQPEVMTASRKRVLDTFFSNFSETGMKSFTKGSLSDKALLDFAICHVLRNDYRLLKKSKDSVLVPAELVDKVTVKYFGRKIKELRKKQYTVPDSSGEAYVFSRISRLKKLGDHLYRAEGVIYVAGSGSTLDPHGTPAQWKKAGEEPDRAGTFDARIEEQSGKFILTQYIVNGQ